MSSIIRLRVVSDENTERDRKEAACAPGEGCLEPGTFAYQNKSENVGDRIKEKEE